MCACASRIDPPGGNSQIVIKAPPRQILDSKRIPSMDRQEHELNSELVNLEEGTRKRNREFKRRMDAIETRQRTYMGVLEDETRNRDKEHEGVVDAIRTKLENMEKAVTEKIEDDFSVFHRELIPVPEQRMTDIEADFEHFVHVTVPKAIDECSGIIARKVEKARETFEIENTKVMKREEKIVERFYKHMERTAQGMEDENATRIAKMHLLREDIAAPEYVDERHEEVQITEMMREVIKIREMIEKEIKERGDEDCLVLDEMLATQNKLQFSVLENFGAGAHEEKDKKRLSKKERQELERKEEEERILEEQMQAAGHSNEGGDEEDGDGGQGVREDGLEDDREGTEEDDNTD